MDNLEERKQEIIAYCEYQLTDVCARLTDSKYAEEFEFYKKLQKIYRKQLSDYGVGLYALDD